VLVVFVGGGGGGDARVHFNWNLKVLATSMEEFVLISISVNATIYMKAGQNTLHSLLIMWNMTARIMQNGIELPFDSTRKDEGVTISTTSR